DAVHSLTDRRNREKPPSQGTMRVIEDRSARGAELLAASQALIDAFAAILTLLIADDLRDTANLAAMHAADLAVRPARPFEVIEALIFGLELLVNVYQFHSSLSLSKDYQTAE